MHIRPNENIKKGVIILKKKLTYMFLSLFIAISTVYLLYPGSYEIYFNKEISTSEIDKYSVFISEYNIYDSTFRTEITGNLKNNYLHIRTNKIGYWLIISGDGVIYHREIPAAGPAD